MAEGAFEPRSSDPEVLFIGWSEVKQEERDRGKEEPCSLGWAGVPVGVVEVR